MKTQSLRGFLVVLAAPEHPSLHNVRYAGVNRIPAYPSKIPEEAEAIDAYVFGDYKDFNTNLIPEFERAVDLWNAFSNSSRQFEILFCCESTDDPLPESFGSEISREQMGFDVAGLSGDYWSIVDDIPASTWALPYMSLLNEYGLFSSRDKAEEYLDEYRRQQEADWDSQFDIVHVVRVAGGPDTFQQ